MHVRARESKRVCMPERVSGMCEYMLCVCINAT
uniref:Uncharacterized protein n=1 Tax=Anguilla anguilla TaxID=7936 RepID=A0A0E9VFV0_ANGAN